MAHHRSKRSDTREEKSALNLSEDDSVRLSRQVTLLDSIAFIVGAVIGSGIFISPTGVLANTGGIGWALLIWVFCGIISMLGALTYAELGTTFPVSGGDFSFILEAYGKIPAFLTAISRFIVRSAAMAILSLTFAANVLLIFYPDCPVPETLTQLVAIAMMGGVVFANSVSVPGSRYISVLMMIAKLLALAAIIIAGMIKLAQGNTENFQNAFDPSEFNFKSLPLAIYSGMYAYTGWSFLVQLTEEIINPSRTIPKAVFISLTLVTAVYLLVNIAYFTVLSPEEVLSSTSVSQEFGQRVFGSFAWTMGLGVALSCLGTINGTIFSISRFLLVASREGMMPSIASMIHVDRKTPLPAAVVMLPIGILMVLTISDVYRLINFLSTTGWIMNGMTCSIVPYMRWKRPELERPFKVPLVIPVVFFLFCVFIVVMSLYSSPVDCGIGLAIFFGGIPVYYIFVWWENKPVWFNQGMDRVTIFFQQLLYVVPPEEPKSKIRIPGRIRDPNSQSDKI
ncbi:cystine/glutamate transporter-like [Diadema antillarum]|uniref:cystine/glutamate transporter-like n=1 Tax=Diadema antillarum TaxID=105358 RepID=UPI003A8C0327